MGSNQSRLTRDDDPTTTIQRSRKRLIKSPVKNPRALKSRAGESRSSNPAATTCATKRGTSDPTLLDNDNPDTTLTTTRSRLPPPPSSPTSPTHHTPRSPVTRAFSHASNHHIRCSTGDSGYSSGPANGRWSADPASTFTSTTTTAATDAHSTFSWYSFLCEDDAEVDQRKVAATAIAAASSSSPSTSPAGSHIPEPPPYSSSFSSSSTPTVALSAHDILRDLTRSPRRHTNRILHAAFAKARLLDDARDRSAVYQAALTWSERLMEESTAEHSIDEDGEHAINVARVWVARCRIEGWGIVADPAAGLETLKHLADHGCWEAFYPLAMCYRDGVDGHLGVNKTLAYQWLSTAAQLESNAECMREDEAKSVIALAQYRVAAMLAEGDGVPIDPTAAVQWFLKSARNGCCQAQYIMGVYHELGLVIEKDIPKAKEFYLSSALQEYALAQTALGSRLVDEASFDEGIRWLEMAAQKDNARALLRLSHLYENGIGVEPNDELAAYYLKAAASRDYPAAQYRLALNYHFGRLVQQNDGEAERHLHRAAEAGYPAAQRFLGLLYMEDLTPRELKTYAMTTPDMHGSSDSTRRRTESERSTTSIVTNNSSSGSSQSQRHALAQRRRKSNRTALDWFRHAAAQGDVRAYVLVGSCYEDGRGVTTDYETALEYYQKAAACPGTFQPAAQVAVGQLLQRMGRHAGAFEWFVRASKHPATSHDANAPSPVRRAKLMVARYYLHGWAGAQHDMARGYKMLVDLAQDEHDGYAHYWLGVCYDEGIPDVCERDQGTAFTHFMLSANRGNVDAEFQVALMLSNGTGVPCDRTEAFQWYKNAAEKRHKMALYSLGLYYLKGLGNVPRDMGKARDCFEQAAELGVTDAMAQLAMIYLSQATHPVPALDRARQQQQQQWRDKAIYWFRKGAHLGNHIAQRELGKLHDAGLGVPQDYQIAFRLFEKAAGQKDALATLLLGSYYQNGHAVDKNAESALALYLEAANLGSPVAPFAAGQVYHTLSRFEEAYAQYRIAANDPRLAKSRIGKTSKLMMARYVLSYVPSTLDDVSPMKMGFTKSEAFEILHRLATEDHFTPSFYWLADCYQQGNGTCANSEEAVRWFTRSADETNDPEAMLKLAMLFALTADDAQALHYFQKSADQDHAEGQYQLGLAYWRGLYGLTSDTAMAVRWFTSAAQQRHGASHFAMGQMALENGDQDVAVAWWQKGADLGHAESMRAQAVMLMHDNEQELSRALQLLSEAAQLGDPESLVCLGRLYQAGTVPTANDEDEDDDTENAGQKHEDQLAMATAYFERAAQLGHVEAMFCTAQLWHAQQQYAAALEYYEQAANHGHLLSRVMRARYRLAGLGGIKADPEAGYKELRDCAEMDHCIDAYNSLGQCHELGLGTQQDDQRALEWYLRSAEATQDAEAMFRVGRMYAQGRISTATDHDAEAVRWYHFAARTSNHARAQYHLGLFCLYGHSEKPANAHPSTDIIVMGESEAAYQHFMEASLQNDCDAMFELGLLLLTALDRPQEGLEWLDRAAQMEHAAAQRELGKLYHFGTASVVRQDHAMAYDLFCRAAHQEDKEACLLLGIYHEHGIHVMADGELAREWYTVAVELGQDWWLAELQLALLLFQSKDTRAEAHGLFQAALAHAPADTHRRTPALYLARYELYGWSPAEAHPERAASWLLSMAEANDCRAYYDVAECFEHGRGLPRDLRRALRWYERMVTAAEQVPRDEYDAIDQDFHDRVALACFKVAECYRLGRGTEPDAKKAAHMYELAHENGSEEAHVYIISNNGQEFPSSSL
ncbi:hypothetical protein BCR43DRAFT_469494 [Syncephalastrum racemosum]|uniref:Sel1 repeat protein n=1 Tax=Syncephalastrum racemosum TaxID=13706 RepID=A0A1X2HNX7_SYNRA|nr:hypothetical protein BCR43DRAFT_469494 [Syncephalastrum racemosum]